MRYWKQCLQAPLPCLSPVPKQFSRNFPCAAFPTILEPGTSLGPGSVLRENGGKNWRARKKISTSEASRAVVWGGERVAEHGDMPLMLPIRSPPPPANKLLLKCQYVKFSSRMSAWARRPFPPSQSTAISPTVFCPLPPLRSLVEQVSIILTYQVWGNVLMSSNVRVQQTMFEFGAPSIWYREL